jgi:hypothetical protein
MHGMPMNMQELELELRELRGRVTGLSETVTRLHRELHDHLNLHSLETRVTALEKDAERRKETKQ